MEIKKFQVEDNEGCSCQGDRGDQGRTREEKPFP